MITINSIYLKNILKHLFKEKTALHAGNLSYLTILALLPALIISISAFNILNKYLKLLEHPYITKMNSILTILNLNQLSNIFINIICINLLSSGIYSLLTTFENLYKFKFKNYIRKKLYSIALSIIIIFLIICGLSISFTLETKTSLTSTNFIIDLTIVLASVLLLYKLCTFQKTKNIYVGAIIASFLLTVLLHFFYTTIINFTKLSTYYGLLTPLIISFLLIYYSCYILYLGIIINYETSKKLRIKNINMKKI